MIDPTIYIKSQKFIILISGRRVDRCQIKQNQLNLNINLLLTIKDLERRSWCSAIGFLQFLQLYMGSPLDSAIDLKTQRRKETKEVIEEK